jgi:hypothetical protein
MLCDFILAIKILILKKIKNDYGEYKEYLIKLSKMA